MYWAFLVWRRVIASDALDASRIPSAPTLKMNPLMTSRPYECRYPDEGVLVIELWFDSLVDNTRPARRPIASRAPHLTLWRPVLNPTHGACRVPGSGALR